MGLELRLRLFCISRDVVCELLLGCDITFCFLSRLMQLEGCEIEEGHAHPLRRK